jgi:hypothetical protein
MRKLFFLLSLLFCFTISFSQKLKVNETDKFTKQRRLQTDEIKMKVKMFDVVLLYLRAVDQSTYITIWGTGEGADVIGDGDQAIFLLDNDSTVTVYSTGVQDYTIGQNGDSYRHQYRITGEDIKKLSEHGIKSIRKYGAGGYIDINIPDKKQDAFIKTAALFLSELNK